MVLTTLESLAEKLTKPEGKDLEFKRGLSSLNPIIKTIIAFANTAGGTLIIGVEDKTKKVLGLPDACQTEESLVSAIRDRIAPPVQPEVNIHNYQGKDLLVVDVGYWRVLYYDKSKGLEKGTYVRFGSSSRRAGPEEIIEMKRNQDSLGFDLRPCEYVPYGEVDWVRVASLFRERLDKDVDDAKFEGLGLLTNRGGRLVPTNAGVLLFGRHPQTTFPFTSFRCGEFRGTTKTDIINTQDIDGGLIGALTEVPKFIRRAEREAIVVDTMQNRTIREFPEVAIREALVNAVAHADYSLTGSFLSISRFSDRLVIQNPGMLPFGMTLESMKKGISKTRNQAICHTLRSLGYMEQEGSGYSRMLSSCREGGYPDPEIEEESSVFRVTFYSHPRVGRSGMAFTIREEAAARHRQILDAIARLDRPQRKDICEATGLRFTAVKRDVVTLTRQGLIERVGENKNDGYYRLCKPQ